MAGKKRYDFATGRYAYAEIEHGLAAVFGADEATQRGALRGRLKRIATLGLPASSPGKGARRQYSSEEGTQLLIALLMEDAGLDPVVVVATIKNTWSRMGLADLVRRASDGTADNPWVLTLRIRQIGGPWRTGDPLSALPWIGVMPRIDERARARYAKHGFRDESDNLVMMFSRSEPDEWLAVRNLTAALTKLEAALRGKDDVSS